MKSTQLATKVCHMTSVHSPEDVRIFHKECVSLAQAGYEVYLVERGESYDKNGVHIVGVGEMPKSRWKRMTKGARRVYEKALELDCDIYHFHDPELLPYGLKLKKKGKRVIFDSHELTRIQIQGKYYLSDFVRKCISKLYSFYENYTLRRIDGVIFPCPIDGEFPLPGKNRVFLNNVPSLSELYDRYDPEVKKEENTVCTIGTLTYSRGIKQLLLAADRADCKVILGGTIRPASFETEIMQMPESKQAEFLGQINRTQVLEVYKRATIGVSSILNVGQYDKAENMPTKVYECMAMGLPVVLTRNTFNEKMVEKYRFGICVDPENIEEFANALRDLLDNPSKMAELGQNGRRAIKERFNWELEQKKLLDLYDRLSKSQP